MRTERNEDCAVAGRPNVNLRPPSSEAGAPTWRSAAGPRPGWNDAPASPLFVPVARSVRRPIQYPELRAVPLAYGWSSARLATTFATASTFLDLNGRPRHQWPVPSGVQFGPRARIAQQAAPCELPTPAPWRGLGRRSPGPRPISPSAEARIGSQSAAAKTDERTSTLSAGRTQSGGCNQGLPRLLQPQRS